MKLFSLTCVLFCSLSAALSGSQEALGKAISDMARQSARKRDQFVLTDAQFKKQKRLKRLERLKDRHASRARCFKEKQEKRHRNHLQVKGSRTIAHAEEEARKLKHHACTKRRLELNTTSSQQAVEDRQNMINEQRVLIHEGAKKKMVG